MSLKTKVTALSASCLALSLFATATYAQDAQAPINFEADVTTFYEEDFRVVLEGNVAVSSGNLELMANEIIVYFFEQSDQNEEGDLKSVEAHGNVRGRQNDIYITSDSMNYDEIKQVAIFEGNAVVTQGDSKVTSSAVRLNIDTGVYELLGRVKGQLRGTR